MKRNRPWAEPVSNTPFPGDDVERIARGFRDLVLLLIVQTALWYFPPPAFTYIYYQILVRVAFLPLQITVYGLEVFTAYKLARHLRWRAPILWAILLTPPFLNLLGILVFGWKVRDLCHRSGTKIGLVKIAKSVLKSGAMLVVIWISYELSQDFSIRLVSQALLGFALTAGLFGVLYGRWRGAAILWMLAVIALLSPIDVRPQHWIGRPRVVPVVIGFPSTDAVLASRRGEVFLDGCVPPPHEAKWTVTW